jgi:ParB family chromosome partitioning protein
MLRLLALPDPVKDMVQKGQLSAGHARALLTAPNPVELAKNIVARGLSVRDAERLANLAKVPKSGAKPSPSGGKRNADLVALERDLTERLGLAVTIESRGAGGSLMIAYKTLDQLDDLLEKLTRS